MASSAREFAEQIVRATHGWNIQDQINRVRECIAARDAEIAREARERLEAQLAGCGVAALGWAKGEQIAGPNDWGWSPSYEDTVKLRRAFERLAGGKSPDQVLGESNETPAAQGAKGEAEAMTKRARAKFRERKGICVFSDRPHCHMPQCLNWRPLKRHKIGPRPKRRSK